MASGTGARSGGATGRPDDSASATVAGAGGAAGAGPVTNPPSANRRTTSRGVGPGRAGVGAAAARRRGGIGASSATAASMSSRSSRTGSMEFVSRAAARWKGAGSAIFCAFVRAA